MLAHSEGTPRTGAVNIRRFRSPARSRAQNGVRCDDTCVWVRSHSFSRAAVRKTVCQEDSLSCGYPHSSTGSTLGTDTWQERHPNRTPPLPLITLSQDFTSCKEKDLKEIFPEEEWCIPFSSTLIERAFCVTFRNELHLRIILFGREHCPARGHVMKFCPICSWAGNLKPPTPSPESLVASIDRETEEAGP